jgi:hypothetical protein
MSTSASDYFLAALGGEGITISPALAQSIVDWSANYINNAAGINILDGMTASETAALEAFFSDYNNAYAYGMATMSAPWYSEWISALTGYDGGSGGTPDVGNDPSLDGYFSGLLDSGWFQYSEQLSQTILGWASDYFDTYVGVDISDGISSSEDVILTDYFGSEANLQSFALSIVSSDWYQGWQDTFSATLGSDPFGYGYKPDVVEVVDRDGNLWDSEIVRPDGSRVESEEAQLYRAYYGAMGRLPDKGGYEWWLGEIQAGRHDLSSMAAGFIYSDEFRGLADTNSDGSISNEELITHIYEGVFEREPDIEGFNWWVGELDSGAKTQAQAFIDMTQSNEYVQKTYEVVSDMLFA